MLLFFPWYITRLRICLCRYCVAVRSWVKAHTCHTLRFSFGVPRVAKSGFSTGIRAYPRFLKSEYHVYLQKHKNRILEKPDHNRDTQIHVNIVNVLEPHLCTPSVDSSGPCKLTFDPTSQRVRRSGGCHCVAMLPENTVVILEDKKEAKLTKLHQPKNVHLILLLLCPQIVSEIFEKCSFGSDDERIHTDRQLR